MCETIVIGGRVIETTGDAKATLGADNLVWDADIPMPMTDDACLCHLDMAATASRIGCVADNQHGGDPFEWHFRKVNDR